MRPVGLVMSAAARAAACVLLVVGCTHLDRGPAALNDESLSQQVASLEARKTRLEDIEAIRRLQSAYGYYLDQGDWDRAAGLFAADGSIEYALDGVYSGRNRVREYLRALGGGKSGLTPGELHEHLLIMPVITLSPDGRSAKGTWRDIQLTGQLGKTATWGEGPYENEYVKRDGVWQIKSLHWYQTLVVPFDGGWAKHDDVNGGKYVSGRLPPDAPPTVTYEPWPGAFTPPFHFGPHGQAPRDLPPQGAQDTARSGAKGSLTARAACLMEGVQHLEDQFQIENLQQRYGYYLDKGMWSQAARLFAATGSLEVQGRGAFQGRARVLEYLQAIGPAGPAEGRLFDNMLLQPMIAVAPDGTRATGRWHLFAQLAQYHSFHEWGLGVYENEYVKEDGVWKIAKLHLYPTLYTPYEEGWGKRWEAYSRFEPTLGPDRPSGPRGDDALHRERAPFHYVNTADSQSSTCASSRPALESSALQDRLGAADRQLARLEDIAAIKNLQATYGYYLATLQWDALTEKFAREGTIEIAMRGIYVGKAAVRRNLNLYGQQGLDHGVLHNHMQLQPVIDLADDGRTAYLRSRAFSMMGNAGKSGMWMGGIYESVLVKEDGVWKFQTDHVMNTYFAPYDIGWKELAPRAPPGITASNPPDRPPSLSFEMYPRSFLPPFHYPDPPED